MDLKQAAKRFLSLLENHDGTTMHGYKVNAARAEFQRLYSEKHKGEEGYESPYKSQCTRLAWEVLGDD